MNDRKVVITLVATVLVRRFSKDVLTALITSELGILVYKDLTSGDTKYNFFGISSILLIFHKKMLKTRQHCRNDALERERARDV